MKKIRARVRQEKESAIALSKELFCLMKKHKKMTTFLIVFEVWVHGLAFHHLDEFQNTIKSIIKIFGLIG